MAMQPAVCSNCGGKIKVDDIDLNGFGKCEFCHVPYKVIDVITVDGLPTVKSLLMSASIAIENKNHEKAVKLYNDVINIKPNCHEAWWGLYICNSYFDAFYQYKDKYGNSGILTKASIMQSTINKYAKRAIEYAPKDIANKYYTDISDEVNFINTAKSGQYDKKDSNGKSGCYIATAVYGSYNCDEVFALRKFRDDCLSKSVPGKLFIEVYYAVSPYLAKLLPYNSLVSIHIKKILNLFVRHIENK